MKKRERLTATDRKAAKQAIVGWLEREVADRQRRVEMWPGTVGDAYRRELLRLARKALAAVRVK